MAIDLDFDPGSVASRALLALEQVAKGIVLIIQHDLIGFSVRPLLIRPNQYDIRRMNLKRGTRRGSLPDYLKNDLDFNLSP